MKWKGCLQCVKWEVHDMLGALEPCRQFGLATVFAFTIGLCGGLFYTNSLRQQRNDLAEYVTDLTRWYEIQNVEITELKIERDIIIESLEAEGR